MDSLLEVSKFISENNLKLDSYGNVNFKGNINYRTSNKNVTEITNVKIIRSGYNDAIHLTECAILQPDVFHLDFTADYQHYRYHKDNKSLVIISSSPKMGGEYKVTINVSN